MAKEAFSLKFSASDANTSIGSGTVIATSVFTTSASLIDYESPFDVVTKNVAIAAKTTKAAIPAI